MTTVTARVVTTEELAALAAANTATDEQRHWFWVGGSRVAHRFVGSWSGGGWTKALCGAGPAVWPAYCGCPEHPEDRPHCTRCVKAALQPSAPPAAGPAVRPPRI